MGFHLPVKGKHLSKAVGMTALLCLSLVGSIFLNASTTHASSLVSHQSATVYRSATKGTMAPFGVVDLQHPIAAAAAARTATHQQPAIKGVRHIPSASRTAATTRQMSPSVASSLVHAGTILQNFNGVGSLDSQVTNFGAKFEPPDQGLCAGNGFVVEPVNSAVTIYRTNGKAVLGPLNVNDLFDEGPLEFTSDPRCYFDKSTDTWFAIVLFIGTDANGNFINEGRTDIAVSQSGDPTKKWTVYHLEANDDGTLGMPNHAGCPCLGDQPLLGIDQENVYVSTNEFSILGPAFNGAQIYAISKDQLFDLSKNVHFVHFDNLNIGGNIATSVQPATASSAADAGYFMNSLDPFGTFDNRIGVWALTDRHKVSEGKFPTLSSTVITTEPYGIPPKAIQKGSTSTLDSGDDRLQQVQFINGDLWGALDTAVTIPNDNAPRAGIAWFQVHPSISHEVVSGSAIAHQGYIASLGNYVLYPAIQAGPDHTAAVVFTFTGPNNFPSAAYAIMKEGHHSFGAITIAADGTGPYDANATRWGDYSYATLDPDHNRFWLATEYIPPVSSQTTTGQRNWGTRVIEVDGRS